MILNVGNVCLRYFFEEKNGRFYSFSYIYFKNKLINEFIIMKKNNYIEIYFIW